MNKVIKISKDTDESSHNHILKTLQEESLFFHPSAHSQKHGEQKGRILTRPTIEQVIDKDQVQKLLGSFQARVAFSKVVGIYIEHVIYHSYSFSMKCMSGYMCLFVHSFLSESRIQGFHLSL